MKLLGIVVVVLAIGITLIPQFNNCQYEGKTLTTTTGRTVPMKCLWTARAELATGLSLVAVGAMIGASRRKESRRNLAIMGVILGVFAILLPTSLIGVCQTPMNCNIVMRPSVLVLSSLVIVASLVGLVASHKGKETAA